jgi:hypothetical protein
MKKFGFTMFVLSAVTIALFQNIIPANADTALTSAQSYQVQGFLQSQADWTNLISSELQKSTGTQVLAPVTGTAQPIDQHALDQDCNVAVVPPAQKGVLSVSG